MSRCITFARLLYVPLPQAITALPLLQGPRGYYKGNSTFSRVTGRALARDYSLCVLYECLCVFVLISNRVFVLVFFNENAIVKCVVARFIRV